MSLESFHISIGYLSYSVEGDSEVLDVQYALELYWFCGVWFEIMLWAFSVVGNILWLR